MLRISGTHHYALPQITATLQVLNLLLEANADFSANNWQGETALVLACCRGRVEITKALLSVGAAICVGERHWAIYRVVGGGRGSEQRDEIVKLLAERDLADCGGQKGLFSATTEGKMKIVRLLPAKSWVQSGSARQQGPYCPHVGCVQKPV